MPNYLCPDGIHTAGPTGKCIPQATGCGWEIASCPSPTCCPEECEAGDPCIGNTCPRGTVCVPEIKYCFTTPCPQYRCDPATRPVQCADGSYGGPTGSCIRAVDGTCKWEYKECPARQCCPRDCGAPPPRNTTLCADGSRAGPTGRCISSPLDANRCVWEYKECPPPGQCTFRQCGPAPARPTVLCPDGVSSAGPTGRCLMTTSGCQWEISQCPRTECLECECGPLKPNKLMRRCPVVQGQSGSRSLYGFTGRCVPNSDNPNRCHWEVQQCPQKACVISGCSSEICAEEAMFSPCIALPPEKMECLRKATCGRDATGKCAWSPSCENNCQISGCNGEICSTEPMVSICIGYPQEVYDCLASAKCAKAADGSCRWDKQCLPN